jgi:formylglycine-generating enzyme required for sulfatase activity
MTMDARAADEAIERETSEILGRASGSRLLGRLALGGILVAGAALGGWFGYQRHQLAGARDVAMVTFEAATVTIGNNRRFVAGRDPEGLSERPAHGVRVEAFSLDVDEVTVDHYGLCVREGACTPAGRGQACTASLATHGDHPINCVTAAQAEAYCGWVDKRLPTEVEWEYAAGGGERLFPWGNELPGPKHANVCGAECTYPAPSTAGADTLLCDDVGCRSTILAFDDGVPTTAPVGRFEGETPEGLRDMAGNVAEWTRSSPCRYPDHDCADTGERVVRGGSWSQRFVLSPEVTTRQKLAATAMSDGVGFRCAR